MGKRFSYGMVGGGPGALIGEIHRRGISMTERADLVAGCFSRNAEKNRRAAQELQIAEDRVYGDYKEMAAAESARADGIDFVCIVTANATHYEIAKEFLMHGIHVACDKPLCFTSAQAQELADIDGDSSYAAPAEQDGALHPHPLVEQQQMALFDGEVLHHRTEVLVDVGR